MKLILIEAGIFLVCAVFFSAGMGTVDIPCSWRAIVGVIFGVIVSQIIFSLLGFPF